MKKQAQFLVCCVSYTALEVYDIIIKKIMDMYEKNIILKFIFSSNCFDENYFEYTNELMYNFDIKSTFALIKISLNKFVKML